MSYEPTQEQLNKIEEIGNTFTVNLYDSVSAGGLCMDNDNERWFFGLDGSILFIPDKTK